MRPETNPDDIHGLVAARGVLTSRGGMTSHAAIVARGMGKPAIVGAEAIRIDEDAKQFSSDSAVVKAGDVITIDGSRGEVILGAVPTVDPKLSGDFATLMGWADERRRLRVRANADTPGDARTARRFGAEGIGLCRTEHMFFGADRIAAVREMILSDTETERRRALAKLLPMQRQDFVEIFRAMDGLPVTIRLLDPPLHEFLPDRTELAVRIATAEARGDLPDPLDAELLDAVSRMHEENPMLGLRGVRLGLVVPGLVAMQVRPPGPAAERRTRAPGGQADREAAGDGRQIEKRDRRT